MLKKCVLIIVSLVFFVVLGAAVAANYKQNASSTPTPSPIQASPVATTALVRSTPAIIIEESKKDDDVKGVAILNILGNSNRLSKSQVEKMDEWRSEIVSLADENRNEVYINGGQEEKAVCLTFDDGPDSRITPKVLDVLKQYNVKGTFFFIGSRLDEFKSVVKRADSEGSLVLSHGWGHLDLKNKKPELIKKEIELTENKLKSIIGKAPAIIRPPYGSVDKTTIDVAKKAGYKLVIWSIDTLDWSQMEKDNIVKNVVSNVRPGDIILMHSDENKMATVEALPEIIKKLKEKGYKFLDLGEMLNIKAYK